MLAYPQRQYNLNWWATYLLSHLSLHYDSRLEKVRYYTFLKIRELISLELPTPYSKRLLQRYTIKGFQKFINYHGDEMAPRFSIFPTYWWNSESRREFNETPLASSPRRTNIEKLNTFHQPTLKPFERCLKDQHNFFVFLVR